MDSMLVFSHLRWNFVFQRPQHLMTRMAKHYRVFFVEEPVCDEGPSRLEMSEPVPNLHVVRPHTSIRDAGYADSQLPEMRRLLEQLVESQHIQRPVVWMYTPMALPLLQGLEPQAVVYDCMDELSGFLNAPADLLHREKALFQVADIVFTGGLSLYRAKQALHANVHCFPSSVEAEHFGQARDASIDHPEQRALPHPRFGFFGVIDERFDPVSVALMADAHPEWQIVLVGPIVKIDPDTLPRRANIHYKGQRAYSELPQFLAGWDVALLPFAINDATRYISPTKVLEYMAAEKPIVSTPIVDVVEPYGHFVQLGRHPQAFVGACERALAEPRAAAGKRIAMMRNVVKATSWDITANKMRALVDSVVTRTGKKRRVAEPWARAAQPVQSRRAIVIGAGPTGLSAAWHLGANSLLLERENHVGGLCRSVVDQGFTFDMAGHIMFSNDPYVHEMYRMLLGDNVHWQNREAWIYSKNVFTRYPFQGALYGLPPEVLKECIVGAIEARFGPLKGDRPQTKATPGGFANFEDFIQGVWGAGVAKHFAVPYNRKLWTVPLNEMETSWLGGRVPMPDLEEMIDGALRPVAKPQGPNARFGYPLRGGFQALMNGFLPQLRGEVRLGAEVARVVPSKHMVVLEDGTAYAYEKLVSTMPLPVLIEKMGDEAPQRIQRAAQSLRHVGVRCVNLGIGRENLTEKHWIYYPEDTVFHRIFVQGNASPHNNPPGGFALTCEITYSPDKPLPADGDALIDRCIDDCIKVGMITEEDAILARNQVDIPFAYVVYDHGRAEHVEAIRHWLRSRDIELAGRYAEWEYYNSDHAFLAGKRAAETVEEALSHKTRVSAPREFVAQLLSKSTTAGS